MVKKKKVGKTFKYAFLLFFRIRGYSKLIDKFVFKLRHDNCAIQYILKTTKMKNSGISMRHIIAGILLTALSFPVSAQTDSLVNLPNLLLPKFTKSIVKLKSGKVNTAVLNYNKVDQQMVFLQDKLTLVLDEPQLVDTIFMANMVFVPFEKGFYQLAVNAPIALFIQYKSYVEAEGYPTLYGAKSQTTAPSLRKSDLLLLQGP